MKKGLRFWAGMTKIRANVSLLKDVLAGLTVGIFLFSSGTEAATDQWKYVGANDKGDRFFYDSTSVTLLSKDLIQVWTKEIGRDGQTKRLQEINCAFRVIRDRQVVNEGQKKAPIRPQIPTTEWRAMEKDPVTKELHKVLCK